MDKKIIEMAKTLRYELHANPGISGQEAWTMQHLMSFIKANTKLEIVDKGRWFYAIYRSPIGKQNIAFRADVDALPMDEGIDIPYGSKIPGAAHKCGHDGHAATLAAFAAYIDSKGSDNNIFFLFQHEEETGYGAAECVEIIGEEKIDEIFAYHNMSEFPLKSVNSREGCFMCASKGMSIYFTGKSSHASEPEKGINPSFAIANVISSIESHLDPKKYTGMVLCTIVNVEIGEKAFGVNAGKGVLRVTIRALNEDEMLQLQKALEKEALEQAEKYGLTVSFEFQDEFPETRNHKSSLDKVRALCEKKGFPFNFVKDAFRGSEDFGHYLKQTKGAYFMIGNGEDYANVHSSQYDFNDEIIETALELFAGLADS